MDHYFNLTKDEKLNGDNYPVWAFKIEQDFIKERIWFAVRDDPPGINEHGLAELGRPVTPADTKAAKIEALYMLIKAVDDNILARYIHVRDLATLWTELRRRCAGNTVARQGALRRRLFSLKFPEGASMTQNFCLLNELLNELAAVNITYADDDERRTCSQELVSSPTGVDLTLVVAVAADAHFDVEEARGIPPRSEPVEARILPYMC